MITDFDFEGSEWTSKYFMLSRLLILCLIHPLSLCLPHDAHFRAGMVLYAPSIATRVPLHWISKEFALCSYDMSHTVSGPVDFSQPFPTIFILYLGFGFPIGVWPCGRLVHSFGQRCTMPLDHMLYAMGCARHGHPSAWGCTLLLSHECPGPIWVVTTSTTAHVQRAPGNHPKPSETNRQKLSHYDRIYFALLALYLHQWAYLKPFWHFTCINEHISNVCPFGIRLHSDLSSLFWYFGIFGTWPYYFGSLISLLIIKHPLTYCPVSINFDLGRQSAQMYLILFCLKQYPWILHPFTRFRKWDTKHTFRSVQSAITHALRAKRSLQIFWVSVHPSCGMALAAGFHRSTSVLIGSFPPHLSTFLIDISIADSSTIFVGVHKGCTSNHSAIEVAFHPPKNAKTPCIVYVQTFQQQRACRLSSQIS